MHPLPTPESPSLLHLHPHQIIFLFSSRHIKRSFGSGGGGDASSVLSSGGRTQKSSGSSKISHGANARDSGGSSGHCTHRSEPPSRIQVSILTIINKSFSFFVIVFTSFSYSYLFFCFHYQNRRTVGATYAEIAEPRLNIPRTKIDLEKVATQVAISPNQFSDLIQPIRKVAVQQILVLHVIRGEYLSYNTIESR